MWFDNLFLPRISQLCDLEIVFVLNLLLNAHIHKIYRMCLKIIEKHIQSSW